MNKDELSTKELRRAHRVARRIAARRFNTEDKLHSTFHLTIAGENPWCLPSDGLSLSTASTKHWERQRYHRARRRESKQVIQEALEERGQADILEAQSYVDELDYLYYLDEELESFCSEVDLAEFHKAMAAA